MYIEVITICYKKFTKKIENMPSAMLSYVLSTQVFLRTQQCLGNSECFSHFFGVLIKYLLINN